MSQCPSPVQLEQMLTERLKGPEHESVETHVKICASCQERLRLLVGNPIGGTSQRESLREAHPLHEPQTPLPQLVSAWSLPPAALPADWARVYKEEPLAQAAIDRPVPGRIGQYELLEKLGRGGMGAVYKARHRELDKIVALKVLPAELKNELTIARFKNEMRAVGKLEHPNIVGAHDGGQLDNTHFLVMEFVDGIDLARLIERHGSLRLSDACELIRQAAVGLQHAYEHGLVHRDIKPSNLMLARNGLVKVLDLGLARSLSDAPAVGRLTATGQVLGTADYIAPEQCEAAHTADIRADIYSLGCTLYHLLAATPPFGGAGHGSWLQKMEAHVKLPVPPIRQWRLDVPVELVAVLDRMLAKNPADRFTIPAEVAAALQPFTAGSDLARLLEPVAAPTQRALLVSLPGASPAPAQPPAALQETPPPATRRERFLELVARRDVRIATLAGCGLLLAVAFVPWKRLWNSPQSLVGVVLENCLPQRQWVDAQEKPLDILAMHIHRSRGEEATPLGELGITSEAAHLDDDVRVEVRLSTLAYCYLIAFNPDGTEQLCHPEDEKDAEGAKAARPAQSADLRYPQKAEKAFGLDAVGLQAFVLVASTRPLLPYAEWRSQIGTIPWQPVKAAGVWQFDGNKLVQLPQVRGTVRQRGGSPKPLQDLCDFFKNRSEFERIRVFAFPVTND
jgi:tRNA A-37 threonylcarbamoyl transferase component Bud32